MKSFLFGLTAVLCFISCNKPTEPQTQDNILRGARWKISSGNITIRLPSGLDTVVNLMDFIPLCHQDDYIRFDSGISGAVFSGPTRCSPSDADSISYIWQLLNNGNNITFYNAFNFVYSVRETFDPPVLDTLQAKPYVIIDTLSVSPLVLDTLFHVNYLPVPDSATSVNAAISGLTKATFTLQYAAPGTWYDTTNGHEHDPIKRVDTFNYKVVYTSF